MGETIEPPKSAPTVIMKQTHLVVIMPNGGTYNFLLDREVSRIGRGPDDNDLGLPKDYNSISRHHFEIHRIEDKYRIIDVGSANGVRLNGELIQDELLNDNDEIRIGMAEEAQEVLLRFQLGTESLFNLAIRKSESADQKILRLLLDPPSSEPYLRIRWPNGQINFFALQKNDLLIGRDANADLRFPENYPFISRKQVEIHRRENEFVLVDLNSANGTYINGLLVKPGLEIPLYDKAIIRFGDDKMGASIGLTFSNPLEPQSPVEGFATIAIPKVNVPSIRQILIGRSHDSQVRLDSPDVSRNHALITLQKNRYLIEDLDSLNGTYVNGEKINKSTISEGDVIQVGGFILVFQDNRLIPYKSQGTRLDISNLSKSVNVNNESLKILDDVSFTVMPGEFVGLVGSSGAGKSTLLNALIGVHPVDGQVKLNGMDFFSDYEGFRSHLGYVPQNDILHTTLTVEAALDYSARLRLPRDISAVERHQRISNVLEVVSMNTETIRTSRIANLSGGQRKRVSIASELLADPQLIYLDEATSGLDPGLEKKMMYTLRRLADEGRTVVLVTHATANIIQTDHVAFLSQGKLVYFGPSQESLEFFEVDEFADIYDRIDKNGDEWRKNFEVRKPQHFQKYVLNRQKIAATNKIIKGASNRFGIEDYVNQLNVLTQRTMRVLTSDIFTLILMLLLFPLTAILQLIISSRGILTGDVSILADPVAAARTLMTSYVPLPKLNTFIFVMGLEAVLVGMYVPSNELVRDRMIYLRERKVNLKILPYLLSKIFVFTCLAAIQTFLYLIVLSIGVDIPQQGLFLPGGIELFITLFLTMVAGMGIGFVVSAISRTTDMAIYMLVIFMFFEFFFAGTVFDLRDNPAEPLSYLTATRWSLTAIGVTIDIPKIAGATILCNASNNPLIPSSDPSSVCFNYPEARQDLMLSYSNQMLLISWGVLIAMSIICMGVTALLIKRLDRTG